MDSLLALKTEQDGFEVQFEVISPSSSPKSTDKNQQEIEKELEAIDEQYELCEQKVAELNNEIDRLTDHADGFDYTIAVVSGILSGLIDSFFVGDYNPNIEDIVKEFASKKAKRNGKSINTYNEAREWLEKNAHVDHDGAYNQDPLFNKDTKSPNGHTHRLDDLAHHPTLFGLAASIFFQFFRVASFVNNEGMARPVIVKQDIKETAKIWVPAVVSGILIWLANVAEKHIEEELDEELPVPIKRIIKLVATTPLIIRILKCADAWLSHIMSDVGPRTDGTPGKGIPGIFLSFLKEISTVMPSPKLHGAIQALYNSGTMNLDTDLVTIEKMKKQAIPILINEIIVRCFYFVRRLIKEYQEHNNFVDIDWCNTIPFANRTVERMMTIATGTFTTVDIADAAIRSGGFNAACLLRVNFVGVGRFAVAIGTDIGMGIKRGKLQDEKYAMIGQQLDLLNVKISYLDASAQYEMSEVAEEQSFVWKAAEDTVSTLIAANDCVDQAIAFYKESLRESTKSMNQICQRKNAWEQKDPKLTNEMLNIVKWGGQ